MREPVHPGTFLPLADLINEGNVGMVHAATKFDPENGARFVSYVSWWVRQAIHRTLNGAVTVRPKGANEREAPAHPQTRRASGAALRPRNYPHGARRRRRGGDS
ncbi:sigma factor [Longimicrobium sp.]|uniref:sigma factor n=1 Tax=Longimicrobium sp. TaxID=2029185 RepID=UPI003B3AEF00